MNPQQLQQQQQQQQQQLSYNNSHIDAELKEFMWYHGPLGRDDANSKLKGNNLSPAVYLIHIIFASTNFSTLAACNLKIFARI